MATKALATKPAKSGAVVNHAALMERLKAQAAAMAGRTEPASGVSIRVTQDKQFVLPDGTKTREPLSLVIVDFVSRNDYYPGAYDPNNIQPPVCAAIGPVPNQLVPQDNATERQSDSCASCPLNQFGSAGAGKACKNSRVLAVLPADADENTPLWILKVSPTALRSFDGYVNDVARRFNMPPVSVVTTVDFDPNRDYPTLTFDYSGPNDAVATHFERHDEANKLLTQPVDFTPRVDAAPPKGKVAPARRSTPIRR